MVYEFTITTPLNTLAAAKLKTVLKLEAGIIKDLKVHFPPGSSRMLLLQIFRGGSQVFPKSVNYFRGDNILLEFNNINYPLLFEPYELDAYTWSPDTKFAHDVDIYFDIYRGAVLIE